MKKINMTWFKQTKRIQQIECIQELKKKLDAEYNATTVGDSDQSMFVLTTLKSKKRD